MRDIDIIDPILIMVLSILVVFVGIPLLIRGILACWAHIFRSY